MALICADMADSDECQADNEMHMKIEDPLEIDGDDFEYIEEADIISEDGTVHQDEVVESDEHINAMYNCSSCDMLFYSVEEHIRDHHREDKVAVELEEDGSAAGKHFGFEEVTDEDETPEACFKCKICRTVLQSARSLKLHLKMHENKKVESGSADFKNHCHLCNRTFSSDEHLQLHVLAHGGGKHTAQSNVKQITDQTAGTGYPCNYCGKRFKRPHEKVKHERIHTGERPYACELCGKRFRVSSCLTTHLRTHGDSRPFVCPHCKKRFKVQSAYNHHLLTHSNERNYQCPFCTKAFKTAVQLNGHKKCHTKPFSCSECNRPFGSLFLVRKHMQVHQKTDNKLSYSCDICGATYARAFALRDHRKEQHGVEIDQQDSRPETDSNEAIVEESCFGLHVETEEVIEELSFN